MDGYRAYPGEWEQKKSPFLVLKGSRKSDRRPVMDRTVFSTAHRRLRKLFPRGAGMRAIFLSDAHLEGPGDAAYPKLIRFLTGSGEGGMTAAGRFLPMHLSLTTWSLPAISSISGSGEGMPSIPVSSR